MKRILSFILIFLLAIGLIGCNNTEKQDALLQYINVDMVELVEIEEDLLYSYESVTGDNYSSDLETYNEFYDNTILLARELNDAAVTLSFSISDSEILDVHRIYMDYSNKFLSTLSIMISALENQDYTQLAEANEKLNEANNLALDYQQALLDLAEKYDIVWE